MIALKLLSLLLLSWSSMEILLGGLQDVLSSDHHHLGRGPDGGRSPQRKRGSGEKRDVGCQRPY